MYGHHVFSYMCTSRLIAQWNISYVHSNIMYNGHTSCDFLWYIIANRIVLSATNVLAVQGNNDQLLPDQLVEN